MDAWALELRSRRKNGGRNMGKFTAEYAEHAEGEKTGWRLTAENIE